MVLMYSWWLRCVTVFLFIFIFFQQDVQATEESEQARHDVSPPAQVARQSAIDQNNTEALELLAILEEETEIATKSKMNSDYVPGMVTVLHNEHLEALGIRTVAEALTLVPGIQMSRISEGEPSAKVRGFSFPFNAGNIKVMLNSIPLSRESSGINSSVLLTPIEQVERIEVIRGPGSSIYGDFAMAGVVNIFTKKSGGRIFAGGGDDESIGTGGYYNYYDVDRSMGGGVNVSASDNGNNAASLGSDPEEDKSVGIFHFSYENFSFIAEGVRRKSEMNRLTPQARPGPERDNLVRRSSREEKSWAMEARQQVEWGNDVDFEVFLSYLSNELDAAEPRAFSGDRIEGGFDLNWQVTKNHYLLMQLAYAESFIDDASETGRRADESFRISDIERSNYSLGLQDQIAFGDQFTLTLGIRFDDYDDVGNLVTPRIAGVYRLGEHHVLKAQYSQGFRAPTFWELYASGMINETLDFEVMDTFELAYIYRRPKATGRITLYHSEIDDGIYSLPGQPFTNRASMGSNGVEVEWEQQINDRFRWQANVSYTDTSDDRYFLLANSTDRSPGIAEWLGNLAIFWQLAPDFMVTSRWQHVGEQYSFEGGVDGYDTVDLTLSCTDLLRDGLTLRLGVKNIADEEIVYTTQRPVALSEDRYTGRTWWLQLTYNF